MTAEQLPLVSVVIAAFNAERFIYETCRSVLDQTYRNLELIVVDDGSSDGTSDVVAALAAADRRVRLIRQTNGGVAAARNTAIAHASGEFIAPIDADDLWLPTKLEQQVRAMQAQPDAGLVYCWWVWIDAAGLLLDRSPRWRVAGRVFEKLIDINFTGNASVPLFRRAALVEAGGYDSTLQARGGQGCEDWNLALLVASRYPVAVVPAVLVGYRRHDDGMSRHSERMWGSYQAMCQSLAASGRLEGMDLHRSRGQFALHLAGVSFWSRDYWQAIAWAVRARQLTLSLRLAPHVLALFARRIAGRRPTARLRLGDHILVEDRAFPEPLLPYDRIYQQFWRDPVDPS